MVWTGGFHWRKKISYCIGYCWIGYSSAIAESSHHPLFCHTLIHITARKQDILWTQFQLHLNRTVTISNRAKSLLTQWSQQNPRTKNLPPTTPNPIIYQFSLYPHLIHTLIFISSCSALDLALHSYGQRSQIRSHMLPTSIWGEGHVQNGCGQRLPSPLWMEFIKMEKKVLQHSICPVHVHIPDV